MSDVAVNRYTQALFLAASKNKAVASVEEDIEGLAEHFESTGLRQFLENPKNPPEKKQKVVQAIGKKLSSDISASFLRLLLKKSKVGLLKEISICLKSLVKESKGIVPCEVILAQKPNPKFLDKIQASIKRITHTEVEVTLHVDPKMIGGIAVKIKNRILDTTFKTRISDIKKDLLAAKIY